MIWSVVYIASVLVANYTAAWFFPSPVFGAVAVGTLIFGVTFTARDHVHRWGKPYVYTMIGVAAVMSTALSLVGSVDWRIIFASVLAIVISETVDTEVYQRLMERNWLVRVAGSNAVSVPLDTVFFNTVAFAGVLTWPLLASVIVGEIIIKYLVGIVVALWRLTLS